MSKPKQRRLSNGLIELIVDDKLYEVLFGYPFDRRNDLKKWAQETGAPAFPDEYSPELKSRLELARAQKKKARIRPLEEKKMKITQQQLKRIIREEIQKLTEEWVPEDDHPEGGQDWVWNGEEWVSSGTPYEPYGQYDAGPDPYEGPEHGSPAHAAWLAARRLRDRGPVVAPPSAVASRRKKVAAGHASAKKRGMKFKPDLG